MLLAQENSTYSAATRQKEASTQTKLHNKLLLVLVEMKGGRAVGEGTNYSIDQLLVHDHYRSKTKQPADTVSA